MRASVLVLSLAYLAGLLACRAAPKYDDEGVFPNRSTAPLYESDQLQIVGELPAQPGNVDVDPRTGEVYFTFHPFGNTDPKCNVCRLVGRQGYEAFGDQKVFKTVLSVRVAKKSRLLIALDHKNFGETAPTLYLLNLKDGTIVHTYEFPPEVAGKGSFLNDFVISKDEAFVFIADPGISAPPSIITVDMKQWTSKKALVDHESTRSRKTPKDFVMNGKVQEIPFQVGVDSIAISPDGNLLYFGALFDRFMWLIPTKSLVQGGTQPEETVQIAFPKTTSDGIVVDEDTGMLYVTDFQHNAIWMTDPTKPGTAKTLIVNKKLLRWPDGLSVARGYLWITASALDELILEKVHNPPFHILRVPLVKPTDDDGKTEL